MAEAADLENEDALRAWLEGEPREVAIAIAARSALRVLPNLVGIFDETSRGRRAPDVLLRYLRANLTATVAALAPNDGTQQAALSAVAAISGPGTTASDPAAAARSAARSAVFAATDPDAAAKAAAHAVVRAGDSIGAEAVVRAAREDAEVFASAGEAGAFSAPLWPAEVWAWEDGTPLAWGDGQPAELDDSAPEPVPANWRRLRALLLDEDRRWAFWTDWYRRHREGRPQNWPLLARVAAIPNADWDRGPAHVNALIEALMGEAEEPARTEARQALQAARSEAERLGIGGNYPPEPIEAAPTRAEFERLQAALARLQAEVVKNGAPDTEVVAAELDVVETFWRRLRRWCAGKGETFATEFAKEAGRQAAIALFKWAPTLGAVYLAVSAWLQTLGP